MSSGRCQCATSKGEQCKRDATDGKFCFQHVSCARTWSGSSMPAVGSSPSECVGRDVMACAPPDCMWMGEDATGYCGKASAAFTKRASEMGAVGAFRTRDQHRALEASRRAAATKRAKKAATKQQSSK